MKENFYRKVLKNGMTILFEKRDLPVVSVAFAVRAGGMNESENEKGIYHFMEHTLFKGTEKRTTQQISEEIEKKGGTLNAFTGEDLTVFLCKMPSEHLDVALVVLGDIVKNPTFPEKEIEKERKVIFEEIKMYRDNPKMHVFEEIQKNLYVTPFGNSILGSVESLTSIKRNALLDKFKETFTPENMILCVVGNANFEALVRFAEKNFGNKKGKIKKLNIRKKNGSKIERRKGIDQANLVFAYHVPMANDKKSYAAEILSALMVGGMSSRLFVEIREKRNLAYSVGGDSDINKDFAHNFISVGTSNENVEKVRKLILEEFKKVSRGLADKELKQIKTQVIGQHQISMEESQHQMKSLLFNEIAGNARNFYAFERNISKVKLEDVKEIAKNAAKKYSFFALIPE